MSRGTTTVVVLAALMTGLAVGFWASRHGMSRTASAVPAEQERKILYWYDPMVPNQKFDKPGKSPFMEMQLVPKYAGEAGADAGVRVSSQTTQNLGMRLGKVEKTALKQSLSAVGSVAFDEHGVRVMQSRVTGYVTKLLVKASLDRVHQGQPLAELTSPEWLQAEQEYAALLANDSAQMVELRSAARARLRVLDVPLSEILEIERTRRARTATTLFAPIDGVVTELGIREGAAFEAGATLFRINGLSTVWVNAQVPEAQVSQVVTGSSVTAHTAAWPGETFQGRVQALLPEVDAVSRTFTVRAVLENLENKLSPGMFVSLEVAQPQADAQLVVPSEAVITTGQRAVVILALEGDSFAVVEVTTGPQVDGKTVILKGLTEGQSIVVSGQFLIDSEASLRSTIDRLQGARP
jgi:Cu(I)/Ag(I) efflux system membrane fusion protein